MKPSLSFSLLKWMKGRYSLLFSSNFPNPFLSSLLLIFHPSFLPSSLPPFLVLSLTISSHTLPYSSLLHQIVHPISYHFLCQHSEVSEGTVQDHTYRNILPYMFGRIADQKRLENNRAEQSRKEGRRVEQQSRRKKSKRVKEKEEEEEEKEYLRLLG